MAGRRPRARAAYPGSARIQGVVPAGGAFGRLRLRHVRACPAPPQGDPKRVLGRDDLRAVPKSDMFDIHVAGPVPVRHGTLDGLAQGFGRKDWTTLWRSPNPQPGLRFSSRPREAGKWPIHAEVHESAARNRALAGPQHFTDRTQPCPSLPRRRPENASQPDSNPRPVPMPGHPGLGNTPAERNDPLFAHRPPATPGRTG